jgi:DNA polymerase I-like protein with 3'-5' exonuclease and polymerase domains
MFAYDTETHKFGNGNWAPPVVCLTWSDGDDSGIVLREQIVAEVGPVFEDEDTILVGHNTAYDNGCLSATLPELMALFWAAYDEGRIHCTRLRERLLDIAKGNTGQKTRQRSYYSLDRLAKNRAGMVLDKSNTWRLRYEELDGVPLEDWPEEALDYAIDDGIATRRVFLHQSAEADALGYEAFEAESARQAAFDFAMHLMHVWGVRTDPVRVEELAKATEEHIKELRELLTREGILRVNGTKDTKKVKARVAAALASPPTTKTGQIRTNKETLAKCADPVLDAVVDHAAAVKVESTYIDKLWEGTTGNIHCNFHTLGADTGRTSASKPPLQQQPKKGGVRECFVARDGYLFASADYDAQELRTLAQACLDLVGFSKLAERFQEDPGYDPHTDFACSLMNISYAEGMERKAAGDEFMLERRFRAKAANFGFPGGLGAATFVSYARGYGAIISFDESTIIKKEWFEQWPEMVPYFKIVSGIAESGSQLRQLRSGRLRGRVGFCDGANSFFQGLASEASKTAVYMVSKACYNEPDSPLFWSRPWALVHDEILVEVPEAEAHEAAMELQRLMVEAMKVWCPDVPARATPVLSRHWSKKAEPVYRDGRLVAWEG